MPELAVLRPTASRPRFASRPRRIERPLESLFNPSLLPFQPLVRRPALRCLHSQCRDAVCSNARCIRLSLPGGCTACFCSHAPCPPVRLPPQPAHKVAALPPQSRTAFVAALNRTVSGAGEDGQGGLHAWLQRSRRRPCMLCMHLHCSDTCCPSCGVPPSAALPAHMLSHAVHMPAFSHSPPRPRPPAAHPHTKLATLVYCESLCGDVGLVQVGRAAAGSGLTVCRAGGRTLGWAAANACQEVGGG